MANSGLQGVLIAALVVTAACQRSARSPALDPAEIRRYSELQGALATSLPALRDELARIEAEGGLPRQLADAGGPVPVGAAGDDEAQVLHGILATHEVRRAWEQLEGLFDGHALRRSTVAAARAAEILADLEPARNAFRQQLEQGAVRFTVSPIMGPLTDLAPLDDARLYVRLDSLEAVLALADGELPRAEQAVERALTVCALVARQRHVPSRIAAGRMRAEVLATLALVVQDATASAETHKRLLFVLRDQLATWPADEWAWRGDRANGLVTYELVRDGQLMSLLDWTEIRKLQTSRQLRPFHEAVAKNVDADEWFYLRAMRDIISAAQLPYFQRGEALRRIRKEVASALETAAAPLIASQLLLTDFEDGQRLQAEDRARCQAWAVALTVACQQPANDLTTNPLTGQAFQVDRESTRLVLVPDGFRDAEPPIIVPLTVAPNSTLPPSGRRSGGVAQ